MPSLFTHLLIAEDAVQSLQDVELKGLLNSQRHFFFLGNLAPDFPYYDVLLDYRGFGLGPSLSAIFHSVEEFALDFLSLPKKPDSNSWCQRWHQPAASEWIRHWLRWAWDRPGMHQRQMALTSFLTGMLCHVACDEALHPWVEAETGDQSLLKSRSRHQELEIHLDYMLLEKLGLPVRDALPSDMMARWISPLSKGPDFFFPHWLRTDLAQATRKAGSQILDEEILGRWARGFYRGLRLMNHRFSPLAKAKLSYYRPGGSPWAGHFQGASQLEKHYPEALRRCQEILNVFGESKKKEEFYAAVS